MLSDDQLHTFQDRGIIRIESIVPSNHLQQLQDAVFSHFSKLGLRNDDGWDSGALASTPPKAGPKLYKGLKKCREFSLVVDGPVEEVIGQLMGGRPTCEIGERPQMLFTLPNAEEWVLPHAGWHLDLPRLNETEVPGVQIFTFVDTVLPGGGGTLVVAGSHHPLNAHGHLSSQEVKKRLKEQPYFQKLMSKHEGDRGRFLDASEMSDGHEMQVIELHGEPGDVYFVDMRTLHTFAPNASSTPRVMLTHRYLFESLEEAFWDGYS